MEGLAEGEGKECFPDGSTYEGDRHGMVSRRFFIIVVLVGAGAYVANCKEGHGIYTYNDGDFYEGYSEP